MLYKFIGEQKLAKKDFETVISKDSLQEESHTIYALFHLGKVQEAKEPESSIPVQSDKKEKKNADMFFEKFGGLQ